MDLVNLVNNYGGIDNIFRLILLYMGSAGVTFLIVKSTSFLFKIIAPLLFIVIIIGVALFFGEITFLDFDTSQLFLNVKVFIFYIYKFYIDIFNASAIITLSGIITGSLAALLLKR